jgi:hypothetical protein
MPNGAQKPIVEENRKIGNSYAEWGIDGIGALENQGFAAARLTSLSRASASEDPTSFGERSSA